MKITKSQLQSENDILLKMLANIHNLALDGTRRPHRAEDSCEQIREHTANILACLISTRGGCSSE